MPKTRHESIYAVVRAIPEGRVATYGHIACLAEPPCTAREVGWAMAALRGAPTQDPVPWHRVLNAKGMSSIGKVQLDHLAAEGVEIDARGRVALERYGWDGAEWLAEQP